MSMFTEERLQELEQLGPSEGRLFKAELQELIQAYRERPRVVKNVTDGAWLIFKSPSGKSGAISIECLALERPPITSQALREWSDSLRVTLSEGDQQ